jgi:hypothetical protein
MDTDGAARESDMALDPATAVEHPQRPPAWSVGRVIELLDQAIDTAGAQLARSAGLWPDSVTGTPIAEQQNHVVPRRPARRSAVGPWPPSIESLSDGPAAERGPELP